MAEFESSLTVSVPRVAVLLATYNGVGFLSDQLDSIKRQESCEIHLWVSDDHSTDGTWELLCERSKKDPLIQLLPRTGRMGSAARNFYRLIKDVDFSKYDFVAFSDQDDIWFADKMAVSLSRMRTHNAAAFSSNVVALWADGRKELILKSQQQRRMDFLFESGGPGCTYVFSVECIAGFQAFLSSNLTQVDNVQFHDWMLYAWARSRGYRWHIEASPTMYYRQHRQNVYGARVGWSALRKRIDQVRSGWYRQQILRISQLIAGGSSFTEECAATASLVGGRSIISRVRLMMKVPELRRDGKDRAWLLVACMFGGV